MTDTGFDIGFKAADIAAIQTRLNEFGAHPPLIVDGKTGPRTVRAVLEFQRTNGLPLDGVVGPATSKALGSPVWLSFWDDIKEQPSGREAQAKELLRRFEALGEQILTFAGAWDGFKVGLTTDGLEVTAAQAHFAWRQACAKLSQPPTNSESKSAP